ncbi:hypothetical protein DFH09DRAFT_1365472 [Mycena vulgaris]|nr:hypothetical protein DFH09DRAFT_1365472 [Mycena vulgaris]
MCQCQFGWHNAHLFLFLHNLLAAFKFWEKIGTSAVLVLLGSAIDGCVSPSLRLWAVRFIGVRPHDPQRSPIFLNSNQQWHSRCGVRHG